MSEKIKAIRYDSNDMKVIITKKVEEKIIEEKLDIDIHTYICIEEKFKFYLEIIEKLGGCMFQQQIYSFSKLIQNRSDRMTFEDLKKMKELNLINEFQLNNNKYVMLTQKALRYLMKKNKVSPLRKPVNEQLKTYAILADMAKYFFLEKKYHKGKIRNFANVTTALLDPFIKEILVYYNKLKDKEYGELSERQRDFKKSFETTRWFKKNKDGSRFELGHEPFGLDENWEEAYIKQGVTAYIEKQKELFNKTTKKGIGQDDISKLINSKIYLTKVIKSGGNSKTELDLILEFTILDLDRSFRWLHENLKRIDQILYEFQRGFKYSYLKAKIIVVTSSHGQKQSVEEYFKKTFKQSNKNKEKLKQTQYIHQKQDDRTYFYIENFEIVNLDTDRFFKQLIRDENFEIAKSTEFKELLKQK